MIDHVDAIYRSECAIQLINYDHLQFKTCCNLDIFILIRILCNFQNIKILHEV